MASGVVRRTIPFLTKYEKARVIGKRAMQISKGSPPLVEVGNLENPIDIALKELKERKIPFIIRRPLPNGSYEDWRVDELRIDI
jgi:DNA-directed RNA polymerase I, II, and III subunit RPABC2